MYECVMGHKNKGFQGCMLADEVGAVTDLISGQPLHCYGHQTTGRLGVTGMSLAPLDCIPIE